MYEPMPLRAEDPESPMLPPVRNRHDRLANNAKVRKKARREAREARERARRAQRSQSQAELLAKFAVDFSASVADFAKGMERLSAKFQEVAVLLPVPETKPTGVASTAEGSA